MSISETPRSTSQYPPPDVTLVTLLNAALDIVAVEVGNKTSLWTHFYRGTEGYVSEWRKGGKGAPTTTGRLINFFELSFGKPAGMNDDLDERDRKLMTKAIEAVQNRANLVEGLKAYAEQLKEFSLDRRRRDAQQSLASHLTATSSMAPAPPEPTTDELSEALLATTEFGHVYIARILRDLEVDPENTRHVLDNLSESEHPDKQFKAIDRLAEEECRRWLGSHWPGLLDIWGEETLQKFQGWRRRWGVLLDALDGTDLMSMSVNLYCSAAVLYDPQVNEIIATSVTVPTGRTFYAHGLGPPHVRLCDTSADRPLHGCSLVKSLTAARVAFYGQKPRRMATLMKRTALIERLEKIAASKDEGMRIYNFAGNPLLAKIGDRAVEGTIADGVDAIFQLEGQMPHDFVPGAFIALKSNAYMCRLDGTPIDVAELGSFVATPKEPGPPYIVASTQELAEDICTSLS